VQKSREPSKSCVTADSYRAKFSQEKITYPGRKQVFRLTNSDGSLREDIIARAFAPGLKIGDIICSHMA
jgi:hypothetical protein